MVRSRHKYPGQRGFTLVELVATIIILGILAVTVVPKFFSRSGFAEYALRDEVISLLRVAQQRAMYDQGGDCYGVDLAGPLRVVVESAGSQSDLPGIDSIVLANDYKDLSINTIKLWFDGLGNAYTGANCTSLTAVGTQTLTVTGGDQDLSIIVHATGYVTKA